MGCVSADDPDATVEETERRRWLSREELAKRLVTGQADPWLRDDLERLAGETTDDLGPVV